jgi:aryl-alcohol dehydrogenase-like predicted oxidoreductase
MLSKLTSLELRSVGKTDIQITPIMLGSWAIGGWLWGGTDEKDSIAAIQAALDQGINAIDTAAVYGFGYSEDLVGRAIKGRRHQIVLATKCGLRWDANHDLDALSKKAAKGESIAVYNNAQPDSIRFECEQSLKRLKTDFIDIYQIHWPDPNTPLEESWEAMVKLKKQGKVRAIGVSNYNLEQLQKIHSIHPVDSLQSPYSLVRRSIEADLIPFCINNHISVFAYSPLERGLLTGKVTAGYQFPKEDHRATSPTFSAENRANIEKALAKIRPIAEKHQATLAQVIAYCTFHMPGITAAIVGARHPDQAIENAQTAKLQLSDQERRLVVDTLKSYLSLTT